PLVELDADAAFDPREAVLLADRRQHIVALEDDLFARGLELWPSALVDADLLHLLEAHAGKAALVDEELLGRVVVEDRDALMLGVLDLPGRSLHHPPRRADRDLHVHAAEAKPGPAAVHRRIAAADDDHALADRVHVLEGHRGEPIDADMDVGLAFLAAGNAQVLALGRSSAHED